MKTSLCNFDNQEEFIAWLETTNPNKKPMTIERLRSYPGCEKYTDEEAGDIIQLLSELAVIVLEHVAHKKSTCIDNQQVVYLNSEIGVKKIPVYNESKNVAA